METYTGFVKRIVYHNPINGYSVFTLKPKNGRQIKCVGSHLGLREDAHLQVSGEHVDDPRWGEQFSLSSVVELMPSDHQGLIRYLSSVVENVGEEMAEAVVKKFGSDTEHVLKEEPWRLKEVAGIGEVRATALAQAFSNISERQSLVLWLTKSGLSHRHANLVLAAWLPPEGEYTYAGIKKAVKKNPYRLVKIGGISFRVADGVASVLGINRDDGRRVRAGLVWVLHESIGMGHCWIDQGDLCAHAYSLLSCDINTVWAALADHLESSQDIIADGNRIYPARLRNAEYRVSSSLIQLSRESNALASSFSDDVVFENLSPSMGQRRAVDLLRKHSLVVVTGGPGVGKTFLAKALLIGAQRYGASVKMCAPTGKAARRLTQLTGYPASTIHRLLEYSPKVGGFTRGPGNPLDCTFLICDEQSMTDVELAASLFSAVSHGTTVVIIGDVDQLPSVGPGCVLRDVIDSSAVPVVRLTTVHRQAMESEIIRAAHIINDATDGYRAVAQLEELRAGDVLTEIVGDDHPDDLVIADKVLEITKKLSESGVDVVKDLQVMAPMKKGNAGVYELNRRLCDVFNPVPDSERAKLLGGFAAGDRVMHIRNNYKLEVFNGMVGVVDRAAQDKLVVRYDAAEEDQLVEYDALAVNELMLAYACTIHKSQGSEYPYVVVAMHSGQHYMLSKNLIYTAVTRAEKTCILVGNRRGLATAIETVKKNQRRTGLRELLAAGYYEKTA